MILRELPISSVLAVKFTCRAFYANTICEGKEVVDLKKAVTKLMPAREASRTFLSSDPRSAAKKALDEPKWQELQAVATTLIEVEIRHEAPLEKLTCSNCARSKPHGAKGFGDQNFKQRARTRYCNACLYQAVSSDHYPRPLMVLGEAMRHCYSCRMVVGSECLCSNCGDFGTVLGPPASATDRGNRERRFQLSIPEE